MISSQPAWLDQTEYPFKPNFITQKAVRQHYIDEGAGPTILFVHGTPSWSFDFRNIIKKLRTDFRCIAIDHVGFGLSDKPKNADYSLQAHIDRLTHLIRELNLKNIILVAHDFGGPIALEYALKNPENIRQLILLNTWTGSSENEPEFKKLKRILKSPLLPFLYLNLNFSARFLLPKSFVTKKPTTQIRNHFTKPFRSKNERYGTLAFVKSLLNDQDFFESQKNRLHLLSNKPVLLIWGMQDNFVGKVFLKRFIDVFPDSKCVEIVNCGHFPQEENPEVVTSAIRDLNR